MIYDFNFLVINIYNFYININYYEKYSCFKVVFKNMILKSKLYRVLLLIFNLILINIRNQFWSLLLYII